MDPSLHKRFQELTAKKQNNLKSLVANIEDDDDIAMFEAMAKKCKFDSSEFEKLRKGITAITDMESSNSPKKSTIVYPTDAERNWLRILDENKKENGKHDEKFKQDEKELNKLKSEGLQNISSMMKILRDALDERQDQLEKDLIVAFDERQSKMFENMKILKNHRVQNEEAKSDAEELLLGFVYFFMLCDH